MSFVLCRTRSLLWPLGRSLSSKVRSLSNKERSLNSKGRSLSNKGRNLNSKERSLSSNERSLNNKERSLNNKLLRLRSLLLRLRPLLLRLRPLLLRLRSLLLRLRSLLLRLRALVRLKSLRIRRPVCIRVRSPSLAVNRARRWIGIVPLRVKRLSVHPVHRCSSRSSVIYFCKLASVPAGRLLMCYLVGCWLDVPLFFSSYFLWPRTGINTAWAVKACAIIDCSVINDRTVNVSVMDDSSVYIDHGSVIPEPATRPFAPPKPCPS